MLTTAEVLDYLRNLPWKWKNPMPVRGAVQLLEMDGEHELEFVNTHLAGIHLKKGEVYEVPVILRITGKRN